MPRERHSIAPGSELSERQRNWDSAANTKNQSGLRAASLFLQVSKRSTRGLHTSSAMEEIGSGLQTLHSITNSVWEGEVVIVTAIFVFQED